MKYSINEFIITDDVERRFWKFVNKTSKEDCWKWLGSKGRRGYGKLNIDYKQILAHRISYKLHFGDIPKNMLVLHKCDVKVCINPNHLFLGTPLDNMRDKIQKGRARYVTDRDGFVTVYGEKNSNAKLTNEQIREILTKYKTGKYLQKELAEEYKIGGSHISGIVRGKRRKRG